MYTRSQLLDLLKKAQTNPAIKKELVNEAVRQAGIVNSRMKRLDAAGFGDVFGTQAKVRAFAEEHYGGTNLRKSKELLWADNELLKEQLLLTSKFLREHTTVTRVQARANEVAEVLQVPINEGKETELLRFLESDMFNELRRAGSTRFIMDAVEAINEGASIEKLNAAYQKYLNKQVSIIGAFEEWVKIK